MRRVLVETYDEISISEKMYCEWSRRYKSEAFDVAIRNVLDRQNSLITQSLKHYWMKIYVKCNRNF